MKAEASQLPPLRYRFDGFILSSATRSLTRDGRTISLIPRYFDLLRLLIARRHEAVHRVVIRDAVWSDIVVSDSALGQAVRTLRRALGDDAREPRYIRTVSRYGYQFILDDVVEEREDTVVAGISSPPAAVESGSFRPESFESALEKLLAAGDERSENGDSAREAALSLHSLGTEEALARLGRRPGHERARAVLRDTRWEVPGAGPVPVLGAPGSISVLTHLFRRRLRNAGNLVAARATSAACGGGVAGLLAGVLGGATIVFGPGSQSTPGVVLVLAVLGALVGGLGAAGVGLGLTIAEALVRSTRSIALVVLGAACGGLSGALAHLTAVVMLADLFGQRPSPLGGGFEGLLIGAAAGLGYAITTHLESGGMATPHGISRIRASLVSGLLCACAAIGLAVAGCHLGAMSLDVLSRSFPGSQFALDPLARLLGETSPGIVTRLVISAGEGLFFGFGLTFGLTHRPR